MDSQKKYDYDVFISCKSEDYRYGEEIYDFLKQNGIHPFIATIELKGMKDSAYVKALGKALDHSYHLIVFASSEDNISSNWVTDEWETFYNEKNSGRKQGNILTILRDMGVSKLPFLLRKFESFPYELYKERVLGYVETPASRARKEEEQQKMLAQEKQRQHEEYLQSLKNSLDDFANEYNSATIAINRPRKKIQKALRDLGIKSRVCPVCKKEIGLSEIYCPQCAWTLSPFDGISEFYYLVEHVDGQLSVANHVYKNSQESQMREVEGKNKERLLVEEDNNKLKREIGTLVSEKNLLRNKLESLSNENKQITVALTDARIELAMSKAGTASVEEEKKIIEKQLQDIKNENKNLTAQLTSLRAELAILKNKSSVSSQKSTVSTNQTKQQKEKFSVHNGHEYVDLGLSVKWATCNVGATKPEDTGDYFAWGETAPKVNYDWSTYKYCKCSSDTLTKYCTKREYGLNKFLDKRIILERIDDAAWANWGGSWRIPTKAEQDELYNNCYWTRVMQNGVNGYKVTSKINGNSIFLPASGIRSGVETHRVGTDGYYYSSSLYEAFPRYANTIFFCPSGDGIGTNNRCCGLPIRAVCP